MIGTEPAVHRVPNLIIGTAGHVDHGKTALIERLTGINTDRLREEQERGLTIDLGFAWFQLPGGAWAGIVDVPGHERFVKNMLAGVTGIDLFLLVVAADEGVMPQTREHLTILDVLEVTTGLVVITKCDLVDVEMLQLVEAEVVEALKGSVFERAPVLCVSARTGQGMEDLVARLDELATRVAPRDIAGPTRVQIDRCFTAKGLGTVVTGSLIRGRLRVEQELEIAPLGQRVRVRNLEVYGRRVDEVAAPCRVGVNLVGVDKDQIERGQQLIAPGSMRPTWMLDVRLRLARDAPRPLQYRERVRVHHGALEVLGRVVLLDADTLEPGQEAFAQLRLEGPVVAAPGDHFVIRRYSPPYAIGGGVILDATPARHRRREMETLQRLAALESSTALDRARWWAESQSGVFGPSDLALAMQLEAWQAEELVEELARDGVVVATAPGRYVAASRGQELQDRILTALARYHADHPLRPAMPTHRLQDTLGRHPSELLQWALRSLQGAGLAVSEPGGWRLASHRVELSPTQERTVAELAKRAEEAGLTPLARAEALAALAAAGDPEPLLQLALARGDLVAVGDFIVGAAVLAKAARQLSELYSQSGPFAVGEIRNLWGTSRKYVVPILEYFDSTGFTRREGDRRHVLRPPGPREGVT